MHILGGIEYNILYLSHGFFARFDRGVVCFLTGRRRCESYTRIILYAARVICHVARAGVFFLRERFIFIYRDIYETQHFIYVIICFLYNIQKLFFLYFLINFIYSHCFFFVFTEGQRERESLLISFYFYLLLLFVRLSQRAPITFTFLRDAKAYTYTYK